MSSNGNIRNPNYHDLSGGGSGKKLAGLIKKGPSLVRYHMNGCGHCMAMMPEWERLINNLSGKAIVIVDLEQSGLDNVPQSLRRNIYGFPTIVSYKDGDGKTRMDYEGERTADAIEAWLNTQHGGNMTGGKKRITKAKKSNKVHRKSHRKSHKRNTKSKKSNKAHKKSHKRTHRKTRK